MTDGQDYRRFFRIRFPWKDRPVLILDEESLVVIDCCEQGLRFLAGASEHGVGMRVQGIFRLKEGELVEVEGTVVWSQGGQVALELEPPGIPLPIILEEQQRLRSLYPSWPIPDDPERRGSGLVGDAAEET